MYRLTSIGDSLAATPSNNPSSALRVLYYIRRHGRSATEEQIRDNLGLDGMDLRLAMNSLMRNKAVVCVVNA